jgi:hypothetical protein
MKENNMATKDNYTCDGCGALVLYHGPVTMVGGYVAMLCPACRNAWHVYITKHELSDALQSIEVRIVTLHAMCQNGVDRSDDILWLLKDKNTTESRLFDVARAWITVRKQGK